MPISAGHLTYIINHVFLPLKLPHEYDPESPLKDAVLAGYIAEVTRSFRNILKSTRDEKADTTWNILERMLLNVANLHKEEYLNKLDVETALENMRTDEVLPLYIACQNAVVIFRKLQGDYLTFECFEASLPNEDVMKLSKKIQVQYPANPRLLIAATHEVLSTLANLLAFFSSNPIEDALPKTKKGKDEHHETRNVASPRYISEAIAGIIRATQPSNGPAIQTTFVTKRLNDHVLWKSTDNPWRRSPLWLLIRVSLQTTLQERGSDDAWGYKAFLAFFMARILKDAVAVEKEPFTIDLLYFMNAKLGRRLIKMGRCVEYEHNRALRTAGDTVLVVSNILEGRWGEVIKQWEDRKQWTAPDPAAFEDCLTLTFPNSQSYLRKVVNRQQQLSMTLNSFDKPGTENRLRSACVSRPFYSSSTLPSSIDRKEISIALFDFESWVQQHLPKWIDSPSRSEQDFLPLYTITNEYWSAASSHYKDNPECLSLMFLCILELWVALDCLVCEWCELFQEYSPEIAENILDPLLLPYLEQVTRLHKVQDYIKQRHERASRAGSLSIFHNPNSPESFANRFYDLDQASDLRSLQARIEQWAAQRNAEKIQELNQKSSQYESKMKEYYSKSCSYSTKRNRYGDTYQAHDRWCYRCGCRDDAQRLRIIPVEEPFPDSRGQTRAIVFELKCPQPVALWRDMVIKILQADSSGSQERESEIHPLSSYNPLSQFYTPPYPGSRISLASSAKSVAASHYGSPRSFPTSEGLVILQSAGRFKLYDSSKGRWIETMPHPNLRKQCTLRLEGSYVTLQEFHENTTHAPNQVLATQYRCPTDFSINEYIVFGHVRAGNRLQWRNIIRALRAQSLSFSEPSVYFLIIQAIWQAGPMGDSGIYREAHADLEDESFCDQALGEMEAVIQLVGDNWTQSLLLATAISLTLRIHDFAPTKQLQCRALEILKKSRQVAAGWISLLQAGHASQDQANNISRHVLVGISLTLRATYDVNPNNLTSIFSDEDSLTWYLYAGTFISDLVDGSLPKGIHFLAVRDRKMSLKCLPYVSSVCWTKPRLMHKVIERRWSSYRAGSEWHPLSSPADRWWSSWTKGGPKLTSRTVHLNILDGSFLIDGRTFDRLPSNYTSHHAYKTLFGYKEVEDIRPSTMNGMIYEGSYQGHEIHFSLIGNDLVIRRRHGEEIEEFIPSTALSGDLPYGLIKDHHHWYMEDVKTLEVRPISQTWSRNAPRIWRVALGNNGLLLAGTAERQLMSGPSRLVNVHSWIYSHLSKALEPLEPRHDGILVTVDSDDSVTNPSVFIQRHDLTFHVTSSNLLECQSFPGFVLEPNYSGIGGLVGLQTVISLRKANSLYSERKIIVPKGDISSRIGLYGHPLTAINVSSAGGYFAYDIDDLLGRLQGSRSVESDLFLIQLHAFTASPLADPLTRRSATSVALEYLNTSSCFSNHRLSEEARSYLDTLASFTPIRAFYPKYLQVMETVQWNTSLPALSQHPSFLPLVESILDHWRSMDIFHSLGDLLDPIEVPTGMDHLTRRATARNWVYHVSAPASQPLEDSSYQRRDFINGVQSQERERRAFEIAHLANPTVTSFPLCTSLKQTVLAWQSVEKVDRWTWDNVEDWFSSAAVMKKIWCTLYELCKEASPHPTFSLITALSLLRYRGAPVDILSTLMAVNRRIRASEHNFLVSSRLDFTQGSTFDREKLRQVLRGYSIGFERSEEYNIERRPDETGESRYRRGEALCEAEISRQINHAISEVENQWPDPPNRLSITTRRLLDLDDESKSRLHGILLEWSRNRAFLNHIDQISNALRPFYSSSTNSDLYRPDVKLNRIQPRSFTNLGLNELMDSIQPPPSTQNTSPKLPDEVSSQSTNTVASDELEDLFSQLESSAHRELEALYLENLQKSITALTEAEPSFDNHATAPSSERLSNFQRQTRKIASAEFLSLKDSLTPRNYLSTLRSAVGLLPTITPMVLLRRLSLLNRQRISESWKNRLLQYATTVQDAKWGDRMLRLLLAGRIHHLLLEARNRREWKPYEHPDWLLIEIDADLSIRPQQADMAKEMIDPPSGLNSVMQLNMGEGKSSVIVPIVCVSAIDRSHALSRVVVLRSQLRQQFHILRQTITNLCDRQVFYLPFTRNLEIDEQSAQRILQFLNNAASSGAVWLCEPEQLLSLKLLGLDKSLRGQPEDPLGRHIIAIQSWIHQNTHDTIDESDEIFQTKQQVIYTVGSQKSLEAAPWRWELTEKLLDLLAQYLSQCKENESDSFTMEDPKATGGFPSSLRLQNEASAGIIREFLEQSISANDWSIKPTLIQDSLEFVTADNFPSDIFQKLGKHFPESQSQTLQTLLILRGMLQNKILYHVLKDKRYRVNYGLDLKRSLLAVPYRAKDLPSPRSEFGHPDVTILLTCLSYYYRGLDTEMMRQTLKHLFKSATPDLTYEEWLRPCSMKVPQQLRTLKGVNMQDEKELEVILFPLLKHNKSFIDSYLNWVVFPRAAKEFPHKLSSSGWDLAMQKTHVTTGFSGTNDGRFLLPTTITQLDRAAQLHTNAKVLSYLLQEENSTVHQYNHSSDSSSLLDEIRKIEPEPRVILDVGAQVLDRSNREFSQLWIDHYQDHPKIKAVIFFEHDELMVMTPDRLAQPLMDSPYCERLDQCLVYLDDAHTRGTDLRLPDVHAVATLGPKLVKDKLVQGCMRMRKLGHGQSVTFLASSEVIPLIAEAAQCDPEDVDSKHVLIWTIKETWKQLQANLPAYVLQGHSFVRREEAWRQFEDSKISHRQLAGDLCEQESRTLRELYGPDAVNEHAWIGEYHSANAHSDISRAIYDRCKEFEVFSMVDANLNEEKEVELVHEKEVERVVERPKPASAANHQLEPDVKNFIATGSIPNQSRAFLRVDSALGYTSAPIPQGLSNVFQKLLVTQDFYRTIQLSYSPSQGSMDDFIRPVDWLVAPAVDNPPYVVALSPFEVNKLFPIIRNSKSVRLYLFSPRNNLSMRSFEDFDTFILPSQMPPLSLPRSLVHQINMFSGSIFLRDHETYWDVCKMLGLHFDKLDPQMLKMSRSAENDVMDSTYFVLDPTTRTRLGMGEVGFQESPVPFLKNLLVIRRHGQTLGPSHMGKMLHGSKLNKDDFVNA